MQNITKMMKTGSFSTEQLAGQRLMVGFDGHVFNGDLQTLICDLKVGGVILFTRNLGNPDQIQALCTAIQDCARSADQPPLLISTDQEGGQVARLKAPFTLFPGNPMITAEADAEHFAKVTATELSGVGINMNMAPVLDVDCKAIKSVMAGRAFSDDPRQVSDLGMQVIRHLQQNGIMAVAKHFPGIGRTTADSHFTRPFLDTELKTLELTDLTPFKAAVNETVAGVMLSHIVYTGIDPNWPASLSDQIVRILLREKLRYEGVIMTDDLDMGAIKKHYDITTVIRQIIKADIDIALICHKGPDIETAYNLILKALNTSTSAKYRGLVAVERIMKLKQTYLV
ncbi:beta-N-acetylhexosaminidase [Desulfococcaceae bacterium HSG9]|nr:beta-N-acetylhexosaminidase [Desulfococcaceae bacterium HSG9]